MTETHDTVTVGNGGGIFVFVRSATVSSEGGKRSTKYGIYM